MWTARHELLDAGRTTKVAIESSGAAITFADVLGLWQADESFRHFFNQLLASSPYTAFRWETPPLTVSNSSEPFEFVLLDSPGLDRKPDPQAFAEHFQGKRDVLAVQFSNLGRDAVLVVPSPAGGDGAYGHLAAFVRMAPLKQRHEFWKLIGSAAKNRLTNKPVWLSTAGAGVSWLHARLDDRPKYYGYRPYTTLNRSKP